ncbi:MAG TPA: ABC transporter permease [bacterium]|nr:ABC transporter permease [bacterium]HPR89736.1 ABC transporter permease [bacterium]
MAKLFSEKFFVQLGERTISFFTTVYDIAVLFIQSIRALPSLWFYRRQFLEQIYAFSVKTLPIAAVIAVFIGLGATVQSTYQSSELLTRAVLVNVIFKTTILELCPIILSLVLAGKLGASLAAEIGSMRISEQIEALETMSLDPVGFLVVPRIVAGLLMLPVITIFANALAIFSSFFVSAVATDWISAQEFASGMQMDYKSFELYFGNLIKPAVYGVLIALVGSFFGLRTSGGAKGVGTASTNAVVVSAVFIVIFDYYLGKLLL